MNCQKKVLSDCSCTHCLIWLVTSVGPSLTLGRSDVLSSVRCNPPQLNGPPFSALRDITMQQPLIMQPERLMSSGVSSNVKASHIGPVSGIWLWVRRTVCLPAALSAAGFTHTSHSKMPISFDHCSLPPAGDPPPPWLISVMILIAIHENKVSLMLSCCTRRVPK